MPLQNRVTPFGEIRAMPQRGMFTGNRGIIHDPATRTLTRQRWTSKAWLVCSCDYKGVRRDVMARRSWTELFFLDEATALAAGHRPCFACRRAAAEAFRAAWCKGNTAANAADNVAGNGARPPRVAEIDAVLHRERLDGRAKRLHPLSAQPCDLPTGAMLAAGGESYLVTAGRLLRWSADGYHALAVPAAGLRFDGLLTPPSTLRALAAGYRPVLHASAGDTW
ncbi:MAG TPA: hypothetical protein VND94_08580 [Terriglobia bacterium]|nr:hypothetical protein [Terriglobia bacterium]